MAPIRFAILTISDTCANGEKEDGTGPLIKSLIKSPDELVNVGTPIHLLKGEVCHTAIVQDDEDLIIKQLIDWSDKNKVDVILTIGGTGVSHRDVTPEATKKVIHKEVPGIPTAMLMQSIEVTPMAMLSRAVCGIRGKTLIINLPGSCKGAFECLNVIAPAIPHAVEIIMDNKAGIEVTHKNVQRCTLRNVNNTYTQTYVENITSRPRTSPFPMISVEEATLIIRNMQSTQIERIDAKYALGRILYSSVLSHVNLPPFRASIKDGYAVLASDGIGRRRVLCGVKAGATPISIRLEPGTCVRVNTGAPIPSEATAVVQIEDTKLLLKSSDGTEEEEIDIMTLPVEGQDIRPIGSDIEAGSEILSQYRYIGPVEMGLLAACGCKDVKVFMLPSVGVLSTGDELQEADGQLLKPGRVFDSNRITLISLLRENGFKSIDFGIAVDDESALIQKITEALDKVDVVVTTGSVSMGDRDMLKPILEKHFKAVIHFGRVNMKPGKPTTFATCEYNGKRKYFLCLPGNPVSAIVTTHLFVLPLLNLMQNNYKEPAIVRAKLTSSYNLDPRPEYVSATLKWNDKEPLPLAHRTGTQKSSKLLSYKNGNALLMLPGRTEKKQTLNEGDVVPAMLIGFN
ncbi:hypothetical protein DMN91_009452 [Ooceraea biroi]|nr:gephyrin [Ooceraea biroi]RLU19094.1 hypothetical protein DMN91_009452 [Ooceraea biroi]